MALMCGRYSLTTPVEGLRRLFEFPEQPNLMPRYNIAPTQEVAAVRGGPPAGAGDSGAWSSDSAGRHLVLLRWGLIPVWAREASIGGRMINARSETLADKPAFRSAFRKRRCLIAADGFYEWRKQGKGPKQPYRIARADGGPFAFAGLWERWRDPGDEAGKEAGDDPADKAGDAAWIESCAIATTEANALLRPIHPRMPVILDASDFDAWLDPATPLEAARLLLRPYDGEAEFVARRISTRVNKVANDDPSVLEPLQEAPDFPGVDTASPPLL